MSQILLLLGSFQSGGRAGGRNGRVWGGNRDGGVLPNPPLGPGNPIQESLNLCLLSSRRKCEETHQDNLGFTWGKGAYH